MADSISIDKSSVRFVRGFQSAAELHLWFQEHLSIVSLCFAGRSNVGKSTLINKLFGKKVSKTSKTPGRTQEINLFSFQLTGTEEGENTVFYFFDLPGYGFAQVSKKVSANWDELLGTFFMNLNQNDLVLLLQDARHPQQKADKEFYQFLKQSPVSSMLLFNKYDKLKKQSERAQLKKLTLAINKEYKKMKFILNVSAEKGDNIEQLELIIVTFLLQKIQQF